jgi:F-type H+-transporting ATPase subunit epsilon
MTPSYLLQIITPYGTVYEGNVTHTLIPAEDGFVGILANHAPYVTSSSGGQLDVREKGGSEKRFLVGTGFFEVSKNRATFLAQSFEHLSPKVSN